MFGFYKNFIILQPTSPLAPSILLLSLLNPLFKMILPSWGISHLCCLLPLYCLFSTFSQGFLSQLLRTPPVTLALHKAHAFFPMVSPSKGPPLWRNCFPLVIQQSGHAHPAWHMSHLTSLLGEFPALSSARWHLLKGWLPCLKKSISLQVVIA